MPNQPPPPGPDSRIDPDSPTVGAEANRESARERNRRRYLDGAPQQLTVWHTQYRRRFLVAGVAVCLALYTAAQVVEGRVASAVALVALVAGFAGYGALRHLTRSIADVPDDWLSEQQRARRSNYVRYSYGILAGTVSLGLVAASLYQAFTDAESISVDVFDPLFSLIWLIIGLPTLVAGWLE